MTDEKPRQGVYFGLDEAAYHADPALGSSSMKQLATSAPDYWFNSPHNKMRLDKEDTDAQLVGRAYHKIILEGEAALRKSYAPKTLNWSTKDGMAQKADFAKRGIDGIRPDDWARLMVMGNVVDANQYLRGAFTGGPTEVSIFWTANGVPKKARIDCLKIRANVDAKTIAPQDGIEFPQACIRHMASYNYPVQAEHYNEGRSYLRAFINEGLVFGDYEKDVLSSIAASSSWASVFVFLKKTGAPLTWGCTISPKSPLLDIARATIAKSTENYLTFSKKFGFDQPWLVEEPLLELAIEDLPGWYRG